MKGPAIRLVEAAHRITLPREDWLEAIAEAAAALTPERTSAMAYAFDASEPHRGVAIEAHARRGLDDDFVEATFALNRATREEEAQLFYGEAVVCGTVSEMLESASTQAASAARYAKTVGQRGYPDTFGVTAPGWDGRGIVVNAPISRPMPLDAQRRRLWSRLGQHIRTADQSRRRLLADLEPPAAVVLPSGAVVHATDAARSPDVRERLSRAVRDIDAARSSRGPDDAEEALAMWEGLLDGRWSLLEQFERDGRRFFVVHENAPGIRDPRALTHRERAVVDLVTRGYSNKYTAHELGVSLGTVAKLLQRALDKLGFERRHQLIWVHRRLHRR
jgi:DNA-binding NarL/FixJ family response regulator